MARPVSSTFALLLDHANIGSRSARAPDGQRLGLDFATEDYLGLARHPAVLASASADSEPDHRPKDCPVTAPQSLLAAHLQLPAVLTFASGAEAIGETFAALLSPDDDVLVDSGAHPAMFTAILAARAGLHRFPSGSLDAAERRLLRLARQPRRGRLIVAVPAVSAAGSRVADLAGLSALTRHSGALLVADVSQDFGALGQDGGGVMELQGCLGRIDVVLGSLGKCFAVAGGFAGFRDPALAAAVRRRMTPSPLPVDADRLLTATRIVFSPEGRRLRQNLHGIALRLRNHLLADGARVLGAASPFVPILLPPATALPRTALLASAGPSVTLLQAPQVSPHAPRWRVELNARHSPADIDDLAELIRDVNRAFDRVPPRMPLAV